MARGINKVILVGNVGNEPEVKYTQGGMAVAQLSLATTSVRKDKEGQQIEKTEWHRVKFFGKLAEIVGEYVQKGRQLYIEGSIRYDKFTGSDGIEKYITEIIGDDMQMLGTGDRDGGGQRSGSAPQRSSNNDNRQQNNAPQRANTGGGSGGGRGGAPNRERPQPAVAGGDFGTDFADDDIPFGDLGPRLF